MAFSGKIANSKVYGDHLILLEARERH